MAPKRGKDTLPAVKLRVLVTGASGFVGAALCRELLARGHAVRAAVRRLPAPMEASSRVQYVLVQDIAGELDRRALLEGMDAVVYLAGIAHRSAGEEELRRVNVAAPVRMGEAAAGRVRRFIFTSSLKVHGEDSGAGAFSETDALHPEDLYGRSKAEAERALEAVAARSGMELALIRPPLVYGPGVKANFLRLLRWVDSGWPLPLAGVRNRRSLIYVGNLADALARCVEHPRASGPVLVSDDEIVSTPELVSRIALALARPARLVRVPLRFLQVLATAAGRGEEVRRLTGNLVTDTSATRRLLDWRPPHALDAGLAETARWFRSVRR